MTKPILFLLLVTAIASAQETQNTPSKTSNDSYDMQLDFGAGWDQMIGPSFATFLSDNSMTALDPVRCWRTGWRVGYVSHPLYSAVSSSRMSNFIFGPYGDTQRTRFTWDSTSISAGLEIITLDGFVWSFGAGAAASKFLLQNYRNISGPFPSINGTGGNMDLVSSWNWSPEVETFACLRIFSLKDTTGIWLTMGAQGGWLPLDSVWKLFDDPEVTGVPKPFDFYVRYSIGIGIE
jgi:hypothetical protein